MGNTIDVCGGTHVQNTNDIKRFAVSSIESKGSGIYRIVAHTADSLKYFDDQIN